MICEKYSNFIASKRNFIASRLGNPQLLLGTAGINCSGYFLLDRGDDWDSSQGPIRSGRLGVQVRRNRWPPSVVSFPGPFAVFRVSKW